MGKLFFWSGAAVFWLAVAVDMTADPSPTASAKIYSYAACMMLFGIGTMKRKEG